MILSWLRCVGIPLVTAVPVYCVMCAYISAPLTQFALPFGIWLAVLCAGLTLLWRRAMQ